ncbi:helix-turn-helix domain-containing protein [Nonomuraea salmonea]|uniref:Helix-turn-helix domain-containing protein n=1 Tax=Nonomuraea salmonea TaxID=46181 RepID=A0ABV5NN73_9ACTN
MPAASARRDGGRRQQPLDGSTEAGRFALRLRELRAGRGFTIRRLADKAGYAPGTLSKAASGDQLPSWAVTEAFVQACGEDPAGWRSDWLAANAASLKDSEPTAPADEPPSRCPACGRGRAARTPPTRSGAGRRPA